MRRPAPTLFAALALAACTPAPSPAPPAPTPRVAASTAPMDVDPLPPAVADPEGQRLLDARAVQGTFVLYDVAAKRLTATDPVLAAKGFVPASTFKMPNTLIGLETGAIPDRHFVVPWDGQTRGIADWNRDHDLASAMKHSVVPYYRVVAERVGRARMTDWLGRLRYGNAELEGDERLFWLAPSDGRRGSTLRVSAIDQVRFLERLRARTLPVRKEHMDLVDEITKREEGPGFTFFHKTGTDEDAEGALAWLVGHTEHGGKPYVFALLLRSKKGAVEPLRAIRPELARTLLERGGALPKTEAPLEVAITVDDLPSHGPLPKGKTRLGVHREMLAAFEKHGVRSVTGFVNAKKVEEHPEDRAALEAWIAAGHPLGNHGYGHVSPFAVSLDAYLGEIDRGEPLVRELGKIPGGVGVPYRFPFLQEGTDAASRDAIRRHLAAKKAKVAEVTVDFGDWAWAAPWVRCKERGDEASVRALEASYLANAKTFLRWSDGAAKQMLGRRIRHVLLLHVGAFQASRMDALLDAYEAMGVRWVTLDEALTDGALAIDSGHVGKWGSGLLEQIAETTNVPHPPMPLMPLELLAATCADARRR